MKYFITIMLILLLITSCSSNKYRRAGSLSDAMEKASDEHEGDRDIDAVVYEEGEDDEEDELDSEHSGNYHNQYQQNISHISYEKNDNFLNEDSWLGFRYGTGILSSDSFYGLQSFSFTGNFFYRDRKSFCFDVGGEYAPLQTTATETFDPEEDEIAQALDGGVFSLYAGVSYRYYTTPQYTFLGNYFSIGAKLHSMFWEYKNTLTIDEYDENGDYLYTDTVNHDQIWGLDLNISSGINLIQTDHFKIGLEFQPGIIIWWIDTYQGFTNDVFAPFLYFKTNFNVTFGG